MPPEDQSVNSSIDATVAAAGVDEPTITLDTSVAVEDKTAAKTAPTAEELAAEETRRAGLTEEERVAEDAAKAAAGASQVPERYEIKTPEGVTLIPEIVSEFEGVAKKLNLNQGQAQEIADIGVKLSQRMVTQQQELIVATQKEWTKSSLADPEFGGEKVKENLGIAESAIQAFTTPEYRKLLKDSGLSQHPEVIRTFFRIGQQIQPDKTIRAPGVNGARAETEEARAERLYPAKQAATA